MAAFELVLGNGRVLKTETPSELYYFLKSNGSRVIPKPRPKDKSKRSKKQGKPEEILASV